MLKRVTAARNKMAPDDYFDALYKKIKEVCPIPKSHLSRITTRDGEWWSPDEVAWRVDPRMSRAAKASIAKVKECRDALEDAGIHVTERWGCPILSMPTVTVAGLSYPEEEEKLAGEYRSFWTASAYDLRTTFVAYGVDVDPDEKTPLKQVATQLGEKRFGEFSVGRCMRYRTYKSLVSALRSMGVYESDICDEEKLVELGYDERYAVAQC